MNAPRRKQGVGVDQDGCETVEDLPDCDADGIPDAVDPDDDNDGLTDEEELLFETGLCTPDSDNDGISDGQEALDGSNPLDSGSFVAVLGTTICAEWNGFLHRMVNILELTNSSAEGLTVHQRLSMT